MTPESIILKHIGTIKGLRVPAARFIVQKIMKDLADEGYIIAPVENVKITEPVRDGLTLLLSKQK